MKKSHLACAIAVGLIATTANASPKITGRFYLGELYQDVETKVTNTTTNTTTTTSTSRPTLNSGGSRIRVEGSEALSDKADLEYRLEYSIYFDDDSRTNFTSRNTYLGVKHKDYGTVRAGRLYTPDDDIDYVDNSFLYANGAGHSFSYLGERTNNTIQYISPKLGDKTQVKLHYAMDEDVSATDTKGDLFAGHVLHEADKYNLGLSYVTRGKDFTSIRAMGTIKATDKLTLGLMGQQVDYDTSDNELGFTASAYYTINPMLDVYAQASRTDNYEGVKDAENTTASAGVIKWLKRDGVRIRVYGSASYADKTTYATSGTDVIKTQTESIGVETGLRMDF